jgi:hypothetical protein
MLLPKTLEMVSTLQRLGYELDTTIEAEDLNGSIRIFATLPNDFAVKLKYEYNSATNPPELFSIWLFRIIEGGFMARTLFVTKDNPFKQFDNIAVTNKFSEFDMIMTRVAQGYYSRKFVLDTQRACEDLENL